MARSEADLRRQLNIPAGANVTLIDLDATKTVEVRTHGWTDEMIRGKSVEEFNALIASRERMVESLQQTIDTERAEIGKLREVRARKLAIGD